MIWRSRSGVGVHDHRFGRLERDRPTGGHDAGLLDGLGRDAGQVDGPALEGAPGVEPRQQQEIVHQPAHPAAFAGDQPHQPQQFLRAGLAALLQAVLGQPAHRGQRRAQLMAGIGDETPHPVLRLQGAGLAVRSRQVGGLDAGKHHVQRLGQPPDLGIPRRMVDAPGEVTARDRRRRRLDLPKRRQAGPHQRQSEAGEQHDGGGRGQRVGNLQAGDRAVEVAETARDDQMTSAGVVLHQHAPGVSRRTRGGGRERRSDVTELRGRQLRSVRGAQRAARHADLPVRSDHLDQELRGQRLMTTAVTGLERLPLHDAGGDRREVLKLVVCSGKQVAAQQRGTENRGHQGGQDD